MNRSTQNREVLAMRQQLAQLNRANERLTDSFAGMSILFAIISITVAAGGILQHNPIFALGAGLSLTAAAAFAVSAYDLMVSRRDQPESAPVGRTLPRAAAIRQAA